uniref:ASCH domain-containing protein n=1 Tax=Desulfovibrio sp. U5L TaxID=596152 RepID=I2Q077_9BACT
MMTTMPCLSIRQPWAWAILCAGKDVENRSWSTKYRGPILIHAGKAFRLDDVRDDFDQMECAMMATGTELPDKLPIADLHAQTGGIVGMATVVDCVRGHASPWAIPGEWHWVLTDARPLPFHACKGRLGIFKIEYPHEIQEMSTC